jgi:hypothetical protein
MGFCSQVNGAQSPRQFDVPTDGGVERSYEAVSILTLPLIPISAGALAERLYAAIPAAP